MDMPVSAMRLRRWLCVDMFREIHEHRELLLSLTLREIRVRYKQSILGVLWAIFIPLSMMLIFTFVFTRALKINGTLDLGNMPYAVFAYIGLLPWTFFSSSLTGAVNSLVANRGLVTKVYCPREAFPLSCVASSGFDFAVASTVLIGLIAYFHTFTEWSYHWHASLLFVPVVLIVQLLFTCGLAFLLAMGNLFYRDVRYLFTVIIYLWMFVTEVIYPLHSSNPLYQLAINLNPMTPIISAYRTCIIHGQLPTAWPFAYAALVSIVVFMLSWAWFHKTEAKFAEYV